MLTLYAQCAEQVTMKEGGSAEDKFIRNLHKGDFFGEKALSGEEVWLHKKIEEEKILKIIF